MTLKRDNKVINKEFAYYNKKVFNSSFLLKNERKLYKNPLKLYSTCQFSFISTNDHYQSNHI